MLDDGNRVIENVRRFANLCNRLLSSLRKLPLDPSSDLVMKQRRSETRGTSAEEEDHLPHLCQQTLLMRFCQG